MLYINTYKLLPPQDVAPKLNTHYYVLFSLILESCHISVLFSLYNDFPIFIIPSVAPPCVVQGAKLRPGPLKICKPASRPAGFDENFSIHHYPKVIIDFSLFLLVLLLFIPYMNILKRLTLFSSRC